MKHITISRVFSSSSLLFRTRLRSLRHRRPLSSDDSSATGAAAAAELTEAKPAMAAGVPAPAHTVTKCDFTFQKHFPGKSLYRQIIQARLKVIHPNYYKYMKKAAQHSHLGGYKMG